MCVCLGAHKPGNLIAWPLTVPFSSPLNPHDDALRFPQWRHPHLRAVVVTLVHVVHGAVLLRRAWEGGGGKRRAGGSLEEKELGNSWAVGGTSSFQA